MSIGLGFIAVSNDMGVTWTTTNPFPPIVYDLPVTVIPGSSFDLPFAPVHGIALYRDGYRILRNDGGGADFAISGLTVTLTIPLRSGEVIAIDNTLAGTFGGGVTATFGEVPSGTINGSNVTFTLAHTPTGNVRLTMNGIALEEGTDFTVSTATITMVSIVPRTGFWITCDYVY